ncbi:UDP-N-acetyl-D-mannosamine dehydrogenase [Corynebacterium sp. ACRQP]|uniref:UDP-N-acetyl-D-mannosamine dehydrogenase n=1 Tax=Corynebacterium sp. ACRQP TaxID=2918195 RepID=UPI001EF4FCA3|nr:UDP-N-acetyl-D-mannosamine dehydrogenase [Corynebacterium sp. ACRQP]MCG7236980.1 UDP-N-acetyl-D-mannosamine dehydrogenase [Corynebacterium sp. ACRQP]
MSQHVAFVGLGYIGLPTAVVMANSGLTVTGVDVMQERVDAVNRGEVPIVEPGLEKALHSALESGRFKATTTMPAADAYIVAVPTPFTDDHDVDMEFIFSAVEAIAPKLNGDELIVLESTSPPRTTEKMAHRLLELRPDLGLGSDNSDESRPVVHFAHCPERILPGKAMEELRTNDRIIGGMSQEATRRAVEIYSSFCDGELLQTNDRTAEMAKLTENSFRDVNIAFANELSLICDDLGINVWELIELANHHPRVNILQPGPGVGGHCIAVDPWFIVSTAPQNSNLIRTAREVNDGKPAWVLRKIDNAVERLQNEPKIALFGLAFKPDIDDLRESPALNIAIEVANKYPDLKIDLVEPNISHLPAPLDRPNVNLVDIEFALETSNVLVLLVDHSEFRQHTPLRLNQEEQKEVIDTRGVWLDGVIN